MPYLIDGHNLIPKIAGFHLGEIDDEMQLVKLLVEYNRLSRKQVEVFFDNSPAGQPRLRTFGNVVARFVRSGETADQAISQKISRLGREARNWTVVSSDRQVQSMARSAHAQVISAEAFAEQVKQTLATELPNDKTMTISSDAEDIDGWLNLFGVEHSDKE